jgi:hypothetical protein
MEPVQFVQVSLSDTRLIVRPHNSGFDKVHYFKPSQLVKITVASIPIAKVMQISFKTQEQLI